MPTVIVAGGGLAGLAAAAALGGAGFNVRLFEARAFLGGRATSFPLSGSDDGELIDNCQHVLLRCCVNLLDFYDRLGRRDHIRFYREFYFIEPGGRVSVLRRGLLPAPMHLAGSFACMKCLGAADKAAIARALGALRSERNQRPDLERITMLEWLREKRQPARAIDRFWKQVLVSAVNEQLDRMAAAHGFQVFWTGFLARADAYEMGVPVAPLRELYTPDRWRSIGKVSLCLRRPVEKLSGDGVTIAGEKHRADFYISSVPFERLVAIAPDLAPGAARLEHSPITGIHLWFDRPVTELPHATLLDRTIQWMFNKSEGRYLQLVVSASRSLVQMSRGEVISLARDELAEFFPAVKTARLERAQVIKELRATFSPRPGASALRPPAETNLPNVFLAGDWTRTGWPATMEGAVRSGYLAAEAVTRAAGCPARFLVPEVG